MKDKNKIEKTEKAIEFAGTLKESVDLLKGKGVDTEFVKTLDSAVRKLVRLQKELVALKEKVRAKKEMIEQAREVAIEQSKLAHKIAKDFPEVKKVKAKKEKKNDTESKVQETK